MPSGGLPHISWIDSKKMVKVKECMSEPFQTKYGVPQGSVLGPLLPPLYAEMSLSLLQDCLFDVGDWMRSSKLKFNPDKTEVLLFATNLHRKKFMKNSPAKLLDHEITPTTQLEILESCLTAV